MARPTKKTPEVLDEIERRIGDGEPLRAICREEHMPAWQTVYEWLAADTEFSRRIAHAREVGYDAIAEEALIISDTPVEGVRTKITADGVELVREDMLGHRKLQIETRLKLLAKWSPKKYGEKQTLEHTGPDGKELPTTNKAEMVAALLEVAKLRKQKEDDDLEGLV